MKIFNRKSKIIQNCILDELIEIRRLLENKESEIRSLNWILLSKDDDIKKLKKENNYLKRKTKKKKEGILNENK